MRVSHPCVLCRAGIRPLRIDYAEAIETGSVLHILAFHRAIDALIAGSELDQMLLGNRPAINLPGLSVTVDEMLAALRDVAGDEVAARIEWQADPRIEKIVGSWPGCWDTSRAEQLGLVGDRSFADVIRAYRDES